MTENPQVANKDEKDKPQIIVEEISGTEDDLIEESYKTPLKKQKQNQKENISKQSTVQKTTNSDDKKSKGDDKTSRIVAASRIPVRKTVVPQFSKKKEEKDLVPTTTSTKHLEENIGNPKEIVNSSTEDYNKLKRKYELLKNLRETEVETMYKELKQNSEDRQKASNKVIEQLREEVERLKNQIKKKSGKEEEKQASKLETELCKFELENSELKSLKKRAEEEVKTLKRVGNFYHLLSSISVVPLETDKFECTFIRVKSKELSVRFLLDFSGDEVEYSLIENRAGEIIPNYMKENICFSEEELPIFLNKILLSLYRK